MLTGLRLAFPGSVTVLAWKSAASMSARVVAYFSFEAVMTSFRVSAACTGSAASGSGKKKRATRRGSL